MERFCFTDTGTQGSSMMNHGPRIMKAQGNGQVTIKDKSGRTVTNLVGLTKFQQRRDPKIL